MGTEMSTMKFRELSVSIKNEDVVEMEKSMVGKRHVFVFLSLSCL